MLKSESIAELAPDLIKAQGEIGAAVKDAKNPHLKNKYASLTAVWNAAHDALQKYGFAVVQPPEETEGNYISITTMLIHRSGQYIGGTMRIPFTANRGTNEAQAAGSSVTYARRYSLAAILGVMQEDDDGNGNNGGNQNQGRGSNNNRTGNRIEMTNQQMTPQDSASACKAGLIKLQVPRDDVESLFDELMRGPGENNPARLHSIIDGWIKRGMVWDPIQWAIAPRKKGGSSERQTS